MTLPSWAYRNPETVVANWQARTCAGCKHSAQMTFGEGLRKQTIAFCAIGKQLGRRCVKYEE